MRTVIVGTGQDPTNIVVVADGDAATVEALRSRYDFAIDVTDRSPMPGIGNGWTFDGEDLVPPSPYPSWVLDGREWVAPVAYPQDGENYRWDEPSTSWVQLPPPPDGIV